MTTSSVPKGEVISRYVLIDDHGDCGTNKMSVENIGERFLLVVQFVVFHNVGDVFKEVLSSLSDQRVKTLEKGEGRLLLFIMNQ